MLATLLRSGMLRMIALPRMRLLLPTMKRHATREANELLEAEGIRPARLRRVTGHADREPATRNPLSIRNNRLEVILLRSDGRNN